LTYSLFVSDLHLCQTRPHITRLFLTFIKQRASTARALYILGDLFEYWAGDDDLEDEYHQQVVIALRELSDVDIYLMHGNRDLLLGEAFAQACNATLLPDPIRIDLHGRPALLTHGDLLCTDDLDYQAFRKQVHDPAWQQTFLAQPLSQRKNQIAEYRSRSEQEKSHKTMATMDVNDEAVVEMIRQYQYPPLLIHGHTHHMGRHQLNADGHRCERIVLGDWYESGSYLRVDDKTCEMLPWN
jgi:UDP-2,3-diacylglucosamine hydrolase